MGGEDRAPLLDEERNPVSEEDDAAARREKSAAAAEGRMKAESNRGVKNVKSVERKRAASEQAGAPSKDDEIVDGWSK